MGGPHGPDVPYLSSSLLTLDTTSHMARQHRAWVFTDNQCTNNLTGIFEDTSSVRYAVWQQERGNTGNLHFQGYIEFTRGVRLADVRRIIPTAHWEQRRGTREQAREYCRKTDSRIEGPFEYGNWGGGGTGARTDLSEVKAQIDSGASDLDVAELHFSSWVRYGRSFSTYRALRSPNRDFKTEVRVYHGATGAGKSRRAQLEAGENAFWKSRGNWWCGFDGVQPVVIDEFYGWLPYDFLLRLLDRYPLRVETKGGSVNFASRLIIITSNLPIRDWYSRDKFPNIDALMRRVDLVDEMNNVIDLTQ